MAYVTRGLHGAPGGVLHGFPLSDDERARLLAACTEVRHAFHAPWLPPMLDELTGLLPEVTRMREAMGAERMQKDAAWVRLRRLGALAAWTLQREYAFLSAMLAPSDVEATLFSPAGALSPSMTSEQRRVARLDALRNVYSTCVTVPGAADRAHALGELSARLFRAITEARFGAEEPVPLGEARQRFDRCYASVRDAVLAQRKLSPEVAAGYFPDASPAWRWDALHATPE